MNDINVNESAKSVEEVLEEAKKVIASRKPKYDTGIEIKLTTQRFTPTNESGHLITGTEIQVWGRVYDQHTRKPLSEWHIIPAKKVKFSCEANGFAEVDMEIRVHEMDGIMATLTNFEIDTAFRQPEKTTRQKARETARKH